MKILCKYNCNTEQFKILVIPKNSQDICQEFKNTSWVLTPPPAPDINLLTQLTCGRAQMFQEAEWSLLTGPWGEAQDGKQDLRGDVTCIEH